MHTNLRVMKSIFSTEYRQSQNCESKTGPTQYRLVVRASPRSAGGLAGAELDSRPHHTKNVKARRFKLCFSAAWRLALMSGQLGVSIMAWVILFCSPVAAELSRWTNAVPLRWVTACHNRDWLVNYFRLAFWQPVAEYKPVTYDMITARWKPIRWAPWLFGSYTFSAASNLNNFLAWTEKARGGGGTSFVKTIYAVNLSLFLY